MDAEQIKKQARDENTPPKILAKLAKSKDKEIRRYITENPNTPVEALEKLGEEFPDAIVANPIFNLLLLEDPESKFVLLSLARASTTSVEKLKELAEHQDRDIRVAVAANHKTPTDIINKIFRGDWEMKQSVAKNKNVSKELLCDLAEENSFYVCKVIAQRENLPEEVITTLMKSGRLTVEAFTEKCDFFRPSMEEPDSWHVRNLLASNPSIPRNIINKLIRDNDRHVRAAVAAREDISGKQALLLKHDISRLVRRTLAENSNAFHAIKKLMAKEKENVQNYEKVKLTLQQLEDINTPVEVINSLVDEVPQVRHYIVNSKNVSVTNASESAHDSSMDVRDKLFTEQNTSVEIINLLDEYHEHNRHYVPQKCIIFRKYGISYKYFQELSGIETPEKISSRIAARKNNRIGRLLATNKNISNDIFDRLSENANFNIYLGLIDNPNTPPEILNKLSENENHCIRRGVAKHVNTSIKILELLKSDRHISVREQVAQNTKISPEIIEELANDSAALVRRAIASNPQTSATILDRLKSDCSLTVRRAVAENTNTSIDTLKELLSDEAPKVINSAKENLSTRSL